MDNNSPERYALSFSVGGLFVREAVGIAQLYLELHDWHEVRQIVLRDNLLQARTTNSAVRLTHEVIQRLSVLDAAELAIVVDGSLSERGQILWVAACRRYTFIGEFAEEVVRERFLLLTPLLGYTEFDSFVSRKALWHPELQELAASTRKKLRATMFRLLKEAGLLADGEIVPAILSDRVYGVLDRSVPSDVRFFPTAILSEEAR